MKILFDTNIVLDVLLVREPFFETSANLSDAVEARTIEGYLCATTLTTIDYLVSKFQDKQIAKQAVSKLLALYSIAPVNEVVLKRAINSPFSDFEDSVLYYSAVDAKVDGIVTRNVKDFKAAQLPIYQPADLLALI